ncbi:hypothetical protein D3C73_1559490 [compost metagenome]
MSTGICLRPARKMIIGLPNSQTRRRMMVPRDQSGSPIQLVVVWMPIKPSIWLSSPVEPNISRQRMATATPVPKRLGT